MSVLQLWYSNFAHCCAIHRIIQNSEFNIASEMYWFELNHWIIWIDCSFLSFFGGTEKPPALVSSLTALQFFFPSVYNSIIVFLRELLWRTQRLQEYTVSCLLSNNIHANFKGIVHPKIKKTYSPSGHSRCRWVCFFIGIDLEKFCITSLAHQWILCSEWVPSEWESKQLIKTSQ